METIISELRRWPDPDLCMADAVLSGRILVVRGLLEELGVHEKIRAASVRGVADSLGASAATAVRTRGFDTLHEHVGVADLPRVAKRMNRAQHEVASAVLERLVPPLLRLDRYFYERPSVRLHLPFDRARGTHRALSAFRKSNGEGKLTPQRPHRDSWQDCPINAINIWVAVDTVRADNGVLVFPDGYGADLPHDGPCLAAGHAPGRPYTFDLEPGDALVFHGEQLHATALNSTAHTSHFVSYRLTRTRPRFANEHRVPYVDSAAARGAFSQGLLRYVPELPSRLSPSYLGTRLRRLEARARGRLEGHAFSSSRAGRLEAWDLSTPATIRAPGPNEIVPYDHETCVARRADGRLFGFGRRCPHDGADLAHGYVDGASVRCPWHNLAYDLESGRSACRSLPGLRLFAVEETCDGALLVARNRNERAAAPQRAPIPVARLDLHARATAATANAAEGNASQLPFVPRWDSRDRVG